MRLYQQLILFMLAATVLPLAIVGFWLLRGAEAELTRRIGGEQRAVAEVAAEQVSTQLTDVIDPMQRAASAFPWNDLDQQKRVGALSLLYQQIPGASAVLLLDAKGAPVAGPLFHEQDTPEHPGFSPSGTEALAKAIPVALLKGGKAEVAMSQAYAHSQGRMAALAVAVRLDSGDEAPVALAEIGLGPLAERLRARATPEVGRIDLVDGGGRVVASSESGAVLAPLSPALMEGLKANVPRDHSTSFSAQLSERMLVSSARVSSLGLFSVVSVPERVALAPVRAMRLTVLLSVGAALGVLLVLGALFTRRLNHRLSVVVKGAEAFGRGELATRLPVTGADELSDLSETFNRMGSELQAARVRLERWNDDLRAEVERATADLREAQNQLIEAQKMAAVGQLGAGVAHEINNPLAGILGNTQLLMLDRSESDADFDALRKIEQSAKRCKEITQNLLRFSQQQQQRAQLRPVDVNAVVRDVCAQLTGPAKSEGVNVLARLNEGPLMVQGDSGQLAQTMQALFANARTAMLKADVKDLSVTTREEGDNVLVEVRDTGKGIKPEHLPRIYEPFFTTKDVWSNVGLGLSVAYRVMTEHKGRIDVATEVGKGTAFTLKIPKLGSANSPAATPTGAPTPPQQRGALMI